MFFNVNVVVVVVLVVGDGVRNGRNKMIENLAEMNHYNKNTEKNRSEWTHHSLVKVIPQPQNKI